MDHKSVRKVFKQEAKKFVQRAFGGRSHGRIWLKAGDGELALAHLGICYVGLLTLKRSMQPYENLQIKKSPFRRLQYSLYSALVFSSAALTRVKT